MEESNLNLMSWGNTWKRISFFGLFDWRYSKEIAVNELREYDQLNWNACTNNGTAAISTHGIFYVAYFGCHN